MIEFSAPTILFDPNTTSDAFQQKVCETVTHELSHQVWGELWFDTALRLSLVNSNSRHYSCPRSVCCRSILFLGTVHTYPDIFESAKFFFADLGCVACVSGNFRSKERPRSGIFGFGCARNETRAKKWKRGWGRERKEKFSPPPPPLRHFSRGLCLSFLVLFSETTRKRSLRRLLRIRLPSNQMLFLRR